MTWCRGLEAWMKQDVPLAGYTTYRIGGRAAYFLTPPDASAFATAYRAARASGLPVWVMGLGSNLLVDDAGVEGIVLSTRGLTAFDGSPDDPMVTAGAGLSLQQVVRWAAKHGRSGLEAMAGIPGSVGGAVVMNAGTPEGCIADAVYAVWCADGDGRLYRRGALDVAWDYRRTNLSDPVVEVEFRLRRGDAERVQAAVDAALERKRGRQPVELPSAGCFFKNPPGDAAGRLIEAAGLKGFRVGSAEVSAKHANFIVNHGGARAADVRAVGRAVRDRVNERFGILLENEVRLWPDVSGWA